MRLTLRAVMENRQANEDGAREASILFAQAALWHAFQGMGGAWPGLTHADVLQRCMARAVECMEASLEASREALTFHAFRDLPRGERGLRLR